MEKLTELEIISRNILICTFILGMVVGGTIAVLMQHLTEKRNND